MTIAQLWHRKTAIEPFAIEHATVATGDEDGRTLEDMTIVVGTDGLISQIGPSLTTHVGPEYHHVDAIGKTVAPGLIDSHVHLFSDGRQLNPKSSTPQGQRKVAAFAHSPIGKPYIAAKAKESIMTELNSGVTTLRTLGDVGYEAVALRDAIRAGRLVGPRILASGPLLAIPEGHGAPLIALTSSTPEEARQTAETNLDHGVNAIKIAATGGVTDSQVPGEAGSPQMTLEQMRAICDVAHASDIIVAAHAQSPEGVKRALKAGVDTIEHGSAMDDEIIDLFLHNPNSLRGWSALNPTLSAGLPMLKFPREITNITEVQYNNAHDVALNMVSGAKDAHANGIPVGVGIDSAMTMVTQYATWRELELLVKYADFTPAQAFNAATQVNARILGVDQETGSIEVGKAADLLVLDDDPARNLHTLKQPKLVFAAGHPIWHPHVTRFDEIDSLLDQTI
ncbi:imidazolonepropionase [Bifidobacterium aemilianum]|uniref:Imidazolonepropionase n=1 Tax=Bifidobacterium aemilianum TaxID=2493120 RepID=A0A366KCK4_9BIFI|nr:amidohydrolase family protein [Bifidobacterium aemilianum]RBP98391.1 imidazolonepropionase [Bifidobacterium aemilianum]